MDADNDGQVTCEEFVTAMLTGIDAGPGYLEQVETAVCAVFSRRAPRWLRPPLGAGPGRA